MARVRVVIDHVAGSRRGQRQELSAAGRIRFGRHPECEVSFDANRDLDASSRHAELRAVDAGWVLVDLGSSNGTYVDGRRVTEAPVARGSALSIEFGNGGPRVRLFVGDDTEIETLPPAPVEVRRPRWVVPAIVGGAVFLVIVLAVVLS
ncbi:MAG: FHA domain-containing protein [Deltaproteobacteria bacterium]|nr:FHA domain-containing protein [Deltaproteobacteria bacterium]